MKLTNKLEISRWAYYECKNGNNIKEIRDLITTSGWALSYCENIEDTDEMRSRITDDEYIYIYCREMGDNEIWKRLKDRHWVFLYCLWIKYRPELKKYLDPIDIMRLDRYN